MRSPQSKILTQTVECHLYGTCHRSVSSSYFQAISFAVFNYMPGRRRCEMAADYEYRFAAESLQEVFAGGECVLPAGHRHAGAGQHD